MISAVQFDRSFFKTIHQLFEGSLITPSTLPVDELTGITTVGFPDPKFVFFEFKKSCVRQVLQFSLSWHLGTRSGKEADREWAQR